VQRDAWDWVSYERPGEAPAALMRLFAPAG
jgi:hypothetical protein